MNKMWLPLAAALLLWGGQASAGNDFCDNASFIDLNPNDPSGGTCEVQLMVSPSDVDPSMSSTSPQVEPPLRLHDLTFDAALYSRLAKRDPKTSPENVAFHFGFFEMAIGTDTRTNADVGLVEWAFHPADKSNAERVLVLSLKRTSARLRLDAEWLIPPRQGWSYAGQSGDGRTVLGTDSIDLGTIDNFPPEVHLKRLGNSVYVWIQRENSPILEFQLPDGWVPDRLRNGLVRSTPLDVGMGVYLYWPLEFHTPPVPPIPGRPPIGLPETPLPSIAVE
ncbi:MAG: hypothetical protein ACREP7_04650 [Lysobacter sp.]